MSKSDDRWSRLWMTVLLFIAGATVCLISPVSAEKPTVTLLAHGSGSYYLGENVEFSGVNTGSDSTYLFITGLNLPDGGGRLSSPSRKSVSEDAGSFTVVKTGQDTTWEYHWYTSGLRLDAGTYTVYAVSQPKAKDQLADAAYGTTGIIIKKPFISAGISPSSVTEGQPFTITGTAEGIPPAVQIWIVGDRFVFNTTIPVNPDASFTFKGDKAISGKLRAGQNWLIVQHPMQDNRFDIDVSGDFVRNLKQKNGRIVFRIKGTGSLQAEKAVDALTGAFDVNGARGATSASDTYAVIPFQVAEAGSSASGASAGTAVPVYGASAGKGVTISVVGDRSYYLGEKIIFRGRNTDSDTTFLFITGPGTFVTGPGIPDGGGKLTSPLQKVISGNPASFTAVKAKPDTTWEYSYYTANLPFDAGTYSVYAASQPKAKDQLGPDAACVGIIVKKPFIAGEISSSNIVKEQPFTITGIAEGIPPEVRIWIIGDNSVFNTTVPVNTDASFSFKGDAAVSGKLPTGQNWLIVQHPMADNQFDFVVSGDYVRNLKQNNGTNLFRLTGTGSLQGSDVADALIAAISDWESHDTTSSHDTYTIVPFLVVDAGGSSLRAPAGSPDLRAAP